MSADRWSYCPRCLEREKAETAKLDKEIEAAKAANDFDLFEALLTKRSQPRKPLSETLRQDWELGIVNRGWTGFKVSFKAHCDKCGLDYSFEAKDADLSKAITLFGKDGTEWTRQL